jgi:hypothetical protein
MPQRSGDQGPLDAELVKASVEPRTNPNGVPQRQAAQGSRTAMASMKGKDPYSDCHRVWRRRNDLAQIPGDILASGTMETFGDYEAPARKKQAANSTRGATSDNEKIPATLLRNDSLLFRQKRAFTYPLCPGFADISAPLEELTSSDE